MTKPLPSAEAGASLNLANALEAVGSRDARAWEGGQRCGPNALDGEGRPSGWLGALGLARWRTWNPRLASPCSSAIGAGPSTPVPIMSAGSWGIGDAERIGDEIALGHLTSATVMATGERFRGSDARALNVDAENLRRDRA